MCHWKENLRMQLYKHEQINKPFCSASSCSFLAVAEDKARGYSTRTCLPLSKLFLRKKTNFNLLLGIQDSFFLLNRFCIKICSFNEKFLTPNN